VNRFQPNEAGLKTLIADLASENLRPAAERVAETARQLAPRDTGGMADSIKAIRTGPSQFRVSFDKDHFYGQFVETGTEKMPPRPFLRPALDSIGGRVTGPDQEDS
jgi:HK97 gp10 family phage protein